MAGRDGARIAVEHKARPNDFSAMRACEGADQLVGLPMTSEY